MDVFEADLQTLELDRSASRAEIQQAYRDLVMVWHPDRFTHNARLRQKAEAKLRQFNQAYEHLKQWRRSSVGAGDAPSGPPAASPGMRAGRFARDLRISVTQAEGILRQYRFEAMTSAERCHGQYQGGPFVVAVSHGPLEVMISVPCTSLQGFDRILLSIPCKSTGHFRGPAAQRLLRLLATQTHDE